MIIIRIELNETKQVKDVCFVGEASTKLEMLEAIRTDATSRGESGDLIVEEDGRTVTNGTSIYKIGQ